MGLYPGEVETIFQKFKFREKLGFREMWTLCDLVFGEGEHWQMGRTYTEEDGRRMRLIDAATGGCIETARQIAIDVFDEAIQIDLLWNCCQGAYAQLTAAASEGPIFHRAAIDESATGETLAEALLCTVAKARWKMLQAERAAEQEAEASGSGVVAAANDAEGTAP